MLDTQPENPRICVSQSGPFTNAERQPAVRYFFHKVFKECAPSFPPPNFSLSVKDEFLWSLFEILEYHFC